MTYQEILNVILDHYDDYEFEYHGKRGAICMFQDEIIAGYAGSEIHFKNIEAVLAAPFIEGKTLKEIANEFIFV